MVNNGRENISSTLSLAIHLFILLLPIIKAELYPYGVENGDTKLSLDKWRLGSQEIDLTTSLRLFGDGRLSSVWINTAGTLTYRQLTANPPINYIIDNIAIAPYYAASQGGIIHYRQTTTETALFELIQDDFETALIQPPNAKEIDALINFKPTYALVVTWTNVTSQQNPDLVNSFQIALVTDGVHSFAIYNYDDLQWTSSVSTSHAAAGLFVSVDSQSSCSYELPHSQTAEVSLLPLTVANSGEYGRFIHIISEPFECVSRFRSACEDELPSSDRGTAKPYFGITKGTWENYVIHTCYPGFEIRPGVKQERIDCVYEADYYDNTWDQDASRCIDFNATKTFEVEVGITKVGNNDTLVPPGEMTEKEKEELEKVVEEAVTAIVNLTDVIVVVENVTMKNDSDLTRRTGDGGLMKAKVTIYVPPYTHRKTTAGNISDVITDTITENDEVTGVTFHPVVDVTETTDECLQGCMCRFRKGPKNCRKGKNPLLKPDSCCGGCSGKPYSSTIKACCGDTHIYDPLKARCCNGRVRKGPTGKCP